MAKKKIKDEDEFYAAIKSIEKTIEELRHIFD